MLNNHDYQNVINKYGINFKNFREDINITGSPSRTANRFIFESKKENLFILEKIKFEDIKTKKRILKNLSILHNYKLPVEKYCLNLNNEYLTEYKLRNFQLKKYIPGIPLERPNYLNQKWRAIKSAEFLVNLYKISKNNEDLNISSYKGNLKENIINMISDFRKKDGIYNQKLKFIMKYIESTFLEYEPKLPKRFCHGDYHPLNIIWGSQHINSVIDWEFSGLNYDIYDVANFISCVGMEDPKFINGKFNKVFLNEIKSSNIIEESSWKYLNSFIIALRFGGWLSHWLKKRDPEMINLEISYLNFLFKNFKLK
ncbi:MAG: phosphotransferase [Fusobacteriota bacterium]